ncbi:hypothetical protein [Mangrovibacter plantisponsor]|uniref:Uncharacterized protein n=1 Tax=Mangrovibacter plantisponsor TaxID=451513 RepID=A0A317PGK0_9ENTR|nr:hypothetical protein [Mangrovibacter plantisponsor]PWV99577.1 hypothetical protein DES37_1288 [Mangrovibacter plantisponsor]
MHLNKYQALAIHLREIADETHSMGRDFSIIDTKVLTTSAAAIEELLTKLQLERGDEDIADSQVL